MLCHDLNEYTVVCNEWNSVACNTTRRRLFCFVCVNYDFLLDNNIQKADAFHTSVEPFRRYAGTARDYYNYYTYKHTIQIHHCGHAAVTECKLLPHIYPAIQLVIVQQPNS